LRRSRERFKENSDDKKAALATLRYVLWQLSKIIAPTMPFYAEHLFGAVREDSEEESVHLAQWPKIKGFDDSDLKDAMGEARSIVALALAERSAKLIKVRQPLAKLKVKSQKLKDADQGLLDLIKDEVNVKEIVFDKVMENDIELDTVITEALKEEGEKREMSRIINDLRKEGGYMPHMYVANILSTTTVISDQDFLEKARIENFELISGMQDVSPDDVSKEMKNSDGKVIIIAIPKNKK